MQAIISKVDGKLTIKIESDTPEDHQRNGDLEATILPNEIFLEFPTPQGLTSININDTNILGFQGTCAGCPSLIRSESVNGNISYHCDEVDDGKLVGTPGWGKGLPPVQSWCPRNNNLF